MENNQSTQQSSAKLTKSSDEALSLHGETVAVDSFPGISKLSNPETVPPDISKLSIAERQRVFERHPKGYFSLTQSNRRPRQTVNWNFLLTLLKHSPWLIWVGVLVLLFAISFNAISSLIYGSNLPQAEPQPTPVTTQKPVKTSSQTSSYPHLWLFGAVALSCVAGSLVIYKRLNSSQPHQRRLRSSGRSLTRRQQRKRTIKALPSERNSPSGDARSLATATLTLLSTTEGNPPAALSHRSTTGQRQTSSISTAVESPPPSTPVLDKSEPVVTVLTPEESQPIDSGEESLAEMMDIRKQRSLSSILRQL